MNRFYPPSGLARIQSNQSRRLLAGLHLDLPLLTGLILLCLYGLFVLYSASGQDAAHIERQLIRLALAFTVMIVVAQIPPAQLRRWRFVYTSSACCC